MENGTTRMNPIVVHYSGMMFGRGRRFMELKLRIQAMEQQAQLRDGTFRGFEPDQESPDFISDSNITDLIEALKQEVERLRIETGEIANNLDGYNFGIHHLQYNQQNFFRFQKILLAVFRGLISVTDVVTDDLARPRHEYFNLILGIDFTKSKNDGNEGKNEVGGNIYISAW
ncbi:basic-leucine zipper (bZIP) transcription factor family protein [Artemisia annua]|uniref:Basic-leucine zipper (BZIP) transcription factor family protein n=1 Tax=Artemisia annua TaxID=35608 RepID=A0A2U1MCX8_ARTAN|nr:basic-leucine zipper (bZIP) transcription factor family protein [Artemisia annua]